MGCGAAEQSGPTTHMFKKKYLFGTDPHKKDPTMIFLVYFKINTSLGN